MTQKTMTKFTVDPRYNQIHILSDFITCRELQEIEDWCEADNNYTVYATGIVFHTQQALTAFLLRWS